VSAAQIAPRRSRGIFSTIGAYLPHPTRWRHVVGYMVAVYRREWVGSVFSGFVEPLVVLAGLGIGLGVLVGDRAAEITGGVSYVTYIAPALMASQAMQFGAGEAAWPILGRIMWVRIYHAMVATPLKPTDIIVGAILFMGGKVAFAATFFAGAVTGAVWTAAVDWDNGFWGWGWNNNHNHNNNSSQYNKKQLICLNHQLNVYLVQIVIIINNNNK
jgi:hypothetical protein